MSMLSPEYKKWLVELKAKIRSTQIKAAIAVNSTLILFYWELGEMISGKQTAYGTGFIQQLSKDLQDEFPEIKGLSARNLAFCRQFYQFYSILTSNFIIAHFNHANLLAGWLQRQFNFKSNCLGIPAQWLLPAYIILPSANQSRQSKPLLPILNLANFSRPNKT
jgi:hypothetical protein